MAAAVATIVASRAAPAAGLDPALVQRVDAYVESIMAADRIPGVALAIVDSGTVAYARGFGLACPGGPPVGPRTPFVLGSMSKSFTALAVMQLVEAGKVELDAPVQRYLHEFRVADSEASAKITVRHLLHQTSGLTARAPTAGLRGDLDAHVRALDNAKLAGPPGQAHRYASPNFQVLGRVVEAVSGEDFGAYVTQHIFAPLGLRSSWTAPPEGMACGHRYLFGVPAAAEHPHELGRLPTAALISSAHDLARYLIALLDGGRGQVGPVLSPAGVQQLLAPGADGGGFSYAMGWRVGKLRGEPVFHHGGVVYDFRGKMIALTERKQAVVVLTNASSAFGRTSSHVIANGVAALLAERRPGRPGWPLSWFLSGIAVAMVLMTLSLVKEAVTARKWADDKAKAIRAGGVKGRLPWLAVSWGLFAPPAILVAVPIAFGPGWGELLRAAPDLCWWLLCVAPISWLVGIVKARMLWRRALGPSRLES